MPLAQLTPALAAVLLAAAAAFLFAPRGEVPTLGRPGIAQVSGARDVEVSVAGIRDYDHYYGGANDEWRDLNPFLPWQQRHAERNSLAAARSRPPSNLRPVPPRKEPVVVADPPPLVIPPLDAASASRPEVVGMIGGGDRPSLMVRHQGEEQRSLTVGDEIGGWVLLGVDRQHALFKDPDGIEHRLVIGTAERPATVLPGGDAGGAGSGTGKGAGGSSAGKAPAKDDTAKAPAQPKKTPPAKPPKDAKKDDGSAAAAKELQRYLAMPEVQRYLKDHPEYRQAAIANPAAAIQIIKQYVKK